MTRARRRHQIVPTDVFIAKKHLKVDQNLKITLALTRTRKRRQQTVVIDGKGNQYSIHSVWRASICFKSWKQIHYKLLRNEKRMTFNIFAADLQAVLIVAADLLHKVNALH